MSKIMDFYCDKLHIRAFETRNEMGVCAGYEIASRLKKLLKEKDSINIMFAAAPSQNETLAYLVADTDIDWRNVNAFHMDEYVGLDPANPAGFRNFLKKAIFNKKNFKSVNLLNGNAPDPTKEAERYSSLLRDNSIDVCILGIGENGHIAFNDPSIADFNDSKLVKIVELERRCREQQVHDGCFSSIEDVPKKALSVTIPQLMSAKYLFCSVPSATKAGAVYNLVNGSISEKCPATILRIHSNAELYIDSDAASQIKQRV